MALGSPSLAHANDFQRVYDYYKQHQTIKPCRFSETQLKNAEHQTPPDVEQYAPSFLDAVASAREQSGNCGSSKAAAAAPTPAAAAPPPTASTATAAPPTASTPTPTPAPAPATTAAPPATATVPAPTPPAGAAGAPALDTQRVSQHTSTPAVLWILAALAIVAVLVALAAVAAWWFGWSADRWARPLGASFTDFGSRFDQTRREFGDWLTTGA